MSLGELWPQNNLWGLWHLNDANDSSGNGRTLTLSGTPTFSNDGRFRGRVNINTTSEYLGRACTVDTNADFAVGVWIRLSSLPSYSWTIFDLRYNHGGCEYSILEYFDNSGNQYFKLNAGDADSARYYITLDTAKWYLLGVSKSGNVQYLYLNGALVAQGASGTNNAAYDSFYLGIYRGTTKYYRGDFAECFLFTEAKSAAWWRKYYALSRGLL